jgi:hypothetical protein
VPRRRVNMVTALSKEQRREEQDKAAQATRRPASRGLRRERGRERERERGRRGGEGGWEERQRLFGTIGGGGREGGRERERDSYFHKNLSGTMLAGWGGEVEMRGGEVVVRHY